MLFETSGEFALIPGPKSFGEPLHSTEVQDIEEYSPQEIAEAILGIENTHVVSSPEPSWWQWQARWEVEDRFISLDMTLFETEPPLWGGSGIVARCKFSEMLGLWQTIRGTHPAVWLHDSECRIWTPESFFEEYIKPALETEGASGEAELAACGQFISRSSQAKAGPPVNQKEAICSLPADKLSAEDSFTCRLKTDPPRNQLWPCPPSAALASG